MNNNVLEIITFNQYKKTDLFVKLKKTNAHETLEFTMIKPTHTFSLETALE